MDSFALFQMLLRQYLEAGGVITYDYNYIYMSRATVAFNGKRGKKYATPTRELDRPAGAACAPLLVRTQPV